MPATVRRVKLVLAIIVAVIFVFVIVLPSSRRWMSPRLAVSRRWSSDSACNRVCFELPRTGNGLGNHLFFFVGALYVALITGRTPCVRGAARRRSASSPLDRVFDLDIERVSGPDRCPIRNFRHMLVYAYNPRVDSLVSVPSNETILLVGSFASWR